MAYGPRRSRLATSALGNLYSLNDPHTALTLDEIVCRPKGRLRTTPMIKLSLHGNPRVNIGRRERERGQHGLKKLLRQVNRGVQTIVTGAKADVRHGPFLANTNLRLSSLKKTGLSAADVVGMPTMAAERHE